MPVPTNSRAEPKNGSVTGEIVGSKVPSVVLMAKGFANEMARVLATGGKVELQSATKINPALATDFVKAGFKDVKIDGNMIYATK
jgi:hypothetical protein